MVAAAQAKVMSEDKRRQKENTAVWISRHVGTVNCQKLADHVDRGNDDETDYVANSVSSSGTCYNYNNLPGLRGGILRERNCEPTSNLRNPCRQRKVCKRNLMAKFENCGEVAVPAVDTVVQVQATEKSGDVSVAAEKSVDAAGKFSDVAEKSIDTAVVQMTEKSSDAAEKSIDVAQKSVDAAEKFSDVAEKSIDTAVVQTTAKTSDVSVPACDTVGIGDTDTLVIGECPTDSDTGAGIIVNSVSHMSDVGGSSVIIYKPHVPPEDSNAEMNSTPLCVFQLFGSSNGDNFSMVQGGMISGMADDGVPVLVWDGTVMHVIDKSADPAVPGSTGIEVTEKCSDGAVPGTESSTESGVQLCSRQQQKTGCKQIYDKVNYCVFCDKEIRSKISRHLLTTHRGHQRVADILKMEKRSKMRMNALHLLANEGNLKHNTAVLKSGNGKIVVSHRDKFGHSKHKPLDYVPCSQCHKFILKKTLWIHSRKCVNSTYCSTGEERLKSDNVVHCKKFGYAVKQSKAFLSALVVNEDEEILKEVLARMRDDEMKQVVMEDTLIRRYACLRGESLGPKEYQKLNDMNRVCQGARTLARLVVECRKKLPGVSLSTLLTPENMNLIVECSKKMAYESPKPAATLGSTIGYALMQAVITKISECVKQNDVSEADRTRQFKEIFRSEWNYRVNSQGVRMRNRQKRNKIPAIPITQDLIKVRTYIQAEVSQAMCRLQRDQQATDWTWSAKLVMTRLIMFNKRRRAEVKDMTVADYVERPNWHTRENGELQMALSQSDALLASRYMLILFAYDFPCCPVLHSLSKVV